MTKIALIGAGSVVFAKKLLGDILQYPALTGVYITLMDIDPARLKVAEIMTQRMIAKLGVTATVSATLDRREAIRDASYVICTIQVGGYREGTIPDFEIPARYGLRQTIADTLGVGGVFRALRTIPVMTALARDIAEVGAPDCILLNYSNPMAMNCWAVARATGIPHVGLCHSVQGTSRMLAAYAGLPYEEVRFLVGGINHMAFFLRFEYRGQDAYPLLFRALEDPNRKSELVRFEMMRRLGYFVTESSEHQSEYTPYFIHHGQDTVDRYQIPINEYLRRSEAITAHWRESEQTLLGKGTDIEVDPPSFEYGARIVHARETNEPAVIYGNVPNTSLITNLPADCCVEVPVLVDGTGLRPTVIGDLPPQLAAIIRTNVNVQELTVEAALTARREHIYHAVMLDPHTSATLPLDKIWAMCDELIEAHQKSGLLGEFSPVAPGTGRAARGLADRVIAELRLASPFSTETDGQTDFEVAISNPGSKPITLQLKIVPPTEALEVVGSQKFTISLTAGQSGLVNFRLRTLRPITDSVHVFLESDDADALCRGMLLKPRKPITRTANGRASFTMELSGVTAVVGSLADASDSLDFAVRVEDSAIVSAEEGRGLLEQSGLRCFFSTLAEGSIREVYLRPLAATGDVLVLDRAGQPVPGTSGTCTKTKLNYTLDVKVPKSAIGLPPDARHFLLQIHAFLGALGDAHSGGLAELVEQFAPWSRDDSYAEVTL